MAARFDDFDNAFSAFDQMLDRFAYDHARREDDSESSPSFRGLGLHENESSLEITLELAGLDEKGIGVLVADGLVTITLQKSADSK